MAAETRAMDVNRLISHASALAAVVSQMVANDVDPAVINGLKSGDAGYTTPPHQGKIYHQMGGGIQYIGSIGGATNFRIATQQTITGIGTSDALTSGAEILFVAQVTSALCADLNNKILGTTAIPAMTDANFNVLLADSGAQVVTSAICASCVNVPSRCVSNASGNSWAYYHTLYAR